MANSFIMRHEERKESEILFLHRINHQKADDDDRQSIFQEAKKIIVKNLKTYH